jgi:hypothetical protein
MPAAIKPALQFFRQRLQWNAKTGSGMAPQVKGNNLLLFFKGMGV